MGKNGYNNRSSIQAHDVPHALSIFLTGMCNLDCTYCFVNKKGYAQKKLNIPRLKGAILKFMLSPGKRKTLSFNGGEPLLVWDVIKELQQYAKRIAQLKESTLECMLVTNGTLLNQEIVDYAAQNNISIRISLDGDKETHDANRKFRGSKHSTFEKIIENLTTITWKNPVSVSMVFTPATLPRLAHNVKFLSQFNFRYIEFLPDLYAHWSDSDVEELAAQLKKVEKDYVRMINERSKNTYRTTLLDTIVNGAQQGRVDSCNKAQVDATGVSFICDKVFSIPTRERNQYRYENPGTANVALHQLRQQFYETSSLQCKKCSLSKFCYCPLGHQLCINEGILQKDFWLHYCAVNKLLIQSAMRIAKQKEFDDFFVQIFRY